LKARHREEAAVWESDDFRDLIDGASDPVHADGARPFAFDGSLFGWFWLPEKL
jgi:hypothetical protein